MPLIEHLAAWSPMEGLVLQCWLQTQHLLDGAIISALHLPQTGLILSAFQQMSRYGLTIMEQLFSFRGYFRIPILYVMLVLTT